MGLAARPGRGVPAVHTHRSSPRRAALLRRVPPRWPGEAGRRLQAAERPRRLRRRPARSRPRQTRPPAPRSASRSSTTAAPPAARPDAPQGAALESAPGTPTAAPVRLSRDEVSALAVRRISASGCATSTRRRASQGFRCMLGLSVLGSGAFAQARGPGQNVVSGNAAKSKPKWPHMACQVATPRKPCTIAARSSTPR